MADDNVIQLQEHALFAGVAPDHLAPLLTTSRIVRYLPGEEIFAEGDDADAVYIIAAGSVRIAARGEHGQVLLTTISAPNMIGEMGVLDGLPRSGTATAVELCTLYVLPAAPFLDLLEHSTLVSMRLLVLLTERLRRTNGRLLDLPAPALVGAS